MGRRAGIIAMSLIAATGCTLIAPFGDLTTSTADGGDARDSGPPPTDADPPMCADGGAFEFDAGPPVDPMGMEICSRLDDDLDGRFDEDVLESQAAAFVPGVSGVGERMRAAAALRGDTFVALFESTAPSMPGQLAAVEATIGGRVQQVVLSAEPVGSFDVSTSARGYVAAWVEEGAVQLAVLDFCGLAATQRLTLDPTNATALRVQVARNGVDVFVAWVGAEGGLSAVALDLRAGLRVGEVAVVAPSGGSMFHDVAVATGASRAWLATIEGPATGGPPHVVSIRGFTTGGDLEPASQMNSAGFEGAGPFEQINVVGDPEDFLILSYNTVDGSVWTREVQLPALAPGAARRFGGVGQVLDSANDASPSSATLLRLSSSFTVSRLGANPDGMLTTDAIVPSLSRSGWLAIVGYPSGPYRFIAVGRDASSGLQYQPVTCR